MVIGGGAGGATAAKYIAKDSKGAIDVTLIEASKRYYTCFFSNLYLGDFRNYGSIGHNMMTITIAAITIGIAVDNSIHYIYRFKENYQATQDYDKTILICNQTVGFDSENFLPIGSRALTSADL